MERARAPWSGPSSGPWSRPARQEQAPISGWTKLRGFVSGAIVLALVIGGAYIARRNLRLGRGDRKGAIAVAVFALVLGMIDWVFTAHHVPELGAIINSFMANLGEAVFLGVLIATIYLALEPYVRRRMPNLLIAWSRLVGGVTGQHVGRLRRVYQRFGATFQQYRGLYWSHFHAALDWDDAEMWLEGAVGSSWSVAQMRDQRWETLGKLEADKPQTADVVASETDEDFEPARTSQPREGASGETLTIVEPFDRDHVFVPAIFHGAGLGTDDDVGSSREDRDDFAAADHYRLADP